MGEVFDQGQDPCANMSDPITDEAALMAALRAAQPAWQTDGLGLRGPQRDKEVDISGPGVTGSGNEFVVAPSAQRSEPISSDPLKIHRKLPGAFPLAQSSCAAKPQSRSGGLRSLPPIPETAYPPFW